MRLALFFAFIALPLMEIALLIKAGQTIGFWPTLAIIVATAIGGSEVIRRQGYATMTEMSQMFEGGRMPLEPALEPFLLINCPSLLFPFLRRLAADITREGGFPPLLLDPIDFGGLFMRRQQEQAAAADSPKS